MRFAWILCAVVVSLPLSAQAGSVVVGSGVIDSVVDGGLALGPEGRAGGPTPADLFVGASFDFTLDIDTSLFELRISGKPVFSLDASFFRGANTRVGISGMNLSNPPFLESFQLAFFITPAAQDEMSRLRITTVCPSCPFPLNPSLGGRVVQAQIRQVPEPAGLLGAALLALVVAATRLRVRVAVL
jgi:hypothetical protein